MWHSLRPLTMRKSDEWFPSNSYCHAIVKLVKLHKELLSVLKIILERIRTCTSFSTPAQRNILAPRKPTSKCWLQTFQTNGTEGSWRQCSSGMKNRRSTFKKIATSSSSLGETIWRQMKKSLYLPSKIAVRIQRTSLIVVNGKQKAVEIFNLKIWILFSY